VSGRGEYRFNSRSMRSVSAQGSSRFVLIFGALTYLFAALVLGSVIVRSTDETVNPSVPALGLTALIVVSAAFFIPSLLRRFSLEVRPGAAYVIAGLSALLSIGPWLITALGHGSVATAIYQGLRIPQGPVQSPVRFWDLILVLQSVDCSQAGVDVYAANNGCLADPSIYGPGTLWLGFVPGDIFSASNATWLGGIALVISTAMVWWLARNSTGLGQMALLASVLGAGWLLILERGNFDLFVMWIAVLVVVLVRRSPTLWSWGIAASLIWLAGTWKYYPFVLGIMLIPLLFVRRGWLVLGGFVIATLAFAVLTWSNVQLSLDANSDMVDLDDFVVLGRVPLIARMLGGDGASATHGWPNLLVLGLGLVALVWGAVWMWSRGGAGLRGISDQVVHLAGLAAGGGALYLISVLVGGFGYAYKASFLLLLIPFLSRPAKSASPRFFVPSAISLVLIAVGVVVVWNTALATSAGVIAAAFALGAAGVVLMKPVLRKI
jgi:hypothetical protein